MIADKEATEDNHNIQGILCFIGDDCTLVRYVDTVQELPDVLVADSTDTLDGGS